MDTIYRHLTLEENLPKIIEDNCLKSANKLSNNPRENATDQDYVALEKYTGSDTMKKIFSWGRAKNKKIFELFFSKEKIERNEIELEKLSNDKIEMKLYVNNKNPDEKISEEEYESIGKYFFVKDELSLDNLTDKCRERINKWKKDNGII